jgi:hypothetical protein
MPLLSSTTGEGGRSRRVPIGRPHEGASAESTTCRSLLGQFLVQALARFVRLPNMHGPLEPTNESYAVANIATPPLVMTRSASGTARRCGGPPAVSHFAIVVAG